MRKAERAVLVGIVVAVAIALRWGFVATAQIVHPLRADAGEYATCAQNLVDHGVFSSAPDVPLPDSFRSPGYPLFLALCRLVGGAGHWQALALALQVACGGLVVLLTYRIARGWLPFGPALGAAVLTALSPHLVAATGYVLTEALTTFVLVAGMALLGWAARGGGPSRCVAAGLGLGAAALCNETLLFVPVTAAVVLWPQLGRRRAAWLLLAGLLPFAGWTLRNQTTALARTGGQRVVASISHGSYPGMVYRDPRLVGFPYREDPEQPAFGSSWTDLGRVLGARFAAEPLRHVSWYLLEKPLWLWRFDLVQGTGALVYEAANDPYERQPVVAATGALMRWLHLPVMLCGALGALAAAWRCRRTPGVAGVLGLCVVLGTFAYLPVVPDPRYLQPVRPLVFVFAAAVAARGFAWLAVRCGRRPAVAHAA